MKTFHHLLCAVITLLLSIAATVTVRAEIFENFNYTATSTTITITGYFGVGGTVIIPSTIVGLPVTSIGNSAFSNKFNITSITIPNSVTTIGVNAFYRVTGLTSVTIGSGVTSIGSSAFQNCERLTSMTIPESVQTIGNNAFQSCRSLISLIIGSGVTSIGDAAFNNCSGLTSVTMGSGVINIGSSAFELCTSLPNVNIPYSVIDIGSNAFSNCTALTSVTIPNSVTSIGTSAFESCTGLASVAIGSSVTSIGSIAFQNCTSMSSVTIPNGVTSILDNTFNNCPKLITIYIKGNAPSLGSTVFTANPRANVFYLLGTTGWTSTYGGISTVALGLPTITGQPFSVIANLGENAEFGVIATTTFPLTLSYQWLRNGLVIPSATAASLYLSNIQSTNIGTYTVIVTADTGSVSSGATLTLTQGLYTQAQYDLALQTGLNAGLTAGIATGVAQVTNSPNTYGLYSLSQMQPLSVGTPLLTKDQATGKFKLTIAAKKSANLLTYTSLPFSAGDATINLQGEMEFLFTSPDNAAFYRLESR